MMFGLSTTTSSPQGLETTTPMNYELGYEFEVYLEGGTGNQGTLILVRNSDGQRGYICFEVFKDNIPKLNLICKHLGYSEAINSHPYYSYEDFSINAMTCSGNESRIDECQLSEGVCDFDNEYYDEDYYSDYIGRRMGIWIECADSIETTTILSGNKYDIKLIEGIELPVVKLAIA